MKSRWSTTFSRIENLWPRDGSCPLPLRSKSFPGNCFRIVKTQKISKRSLLMYGSHRLLRTKFLPLFCSGVVRLAHGKRKVVARYHVQTAYEGFKVRYEESRAQCRHYVLLLSNARIALKVVHLTTKNNFLKIERLHEGLFVKKKNTAHAAQR